MNISPPYTKSPLLYIKTNVYKITKAPCFRLWYKMVRLGFSQSLFSQSLFFSKSFCFRKVFFRKVFFSQSLFVFAKCLGKDLGFFLQSLFEKTYDFFAKSLGRPVGKVLSEPLLRQDLVKKQKSLAKMAKCRRVNGPIG